MTTSSLERMSAVNAITVSVPIATILERLCRDRPVGSRDSRPKSPAAVRFEQFEALVIPMISVSDYVQRVALYSRCSGEAMVLALIYIDRLICTYPFVFVDVLNVHRMYVTAVMVSAKFFDDAYYDNAHYARVGGISAAEINTLELEFLFLLTFDMFVEPDEYARYYRELESLARTQQSAQNSIPIPHTISAPTSHAHNRFPSPPNPHKRPAPARYGQAPTPPTTTEPPALIRSSPVAVEPRFNQQQLSRQVSGSAVRGRPVAKRRCMMADSPDAHMTNADPEDTDASQSSNDAEASDADVVMAPAQYDSPSVSNTSTAARIQSFSAQLIAFHKQVEDELPFPMEMSTTPQMGPAIPAPLPSRARSVTGRTCAHDSLRRIHNQEPMPRSSPPT